MFPIEMLAATLVYAGIFVFLAVCIWCYDRLKELKMRIAVEKSERKARKQIDGDYNARTKTV